MGNATDCERLIRRSTWFIEASEFTVAMMAHRISHEQQNVRYWIDKMVESGEVELAREARTGGTKPSQFFRRREPDILRYHRLADSSFLDAGQVMEWHR